MHVFFYFCVCFSPFSLGTCARRPLCIKYHESMLEPWVSSCGANHDSFLQSCVSSCGSIGRRRGGASQQREHATSYMSRRGPVCVSTLSPLVLFARCLRISLALYMTRKTASSPTGAGILLLASPKLQSECFKERKIRRGDHAGSAQDGHHCATCPAGSEE